MDWRVIIGIVVKKHLKNIFNHRRLLWDESPIRSLVLFNIFRDTIQNYTNRLSITTS